MKLAAVVALRNPGLRYAATRHNVGAWLLDALVSKGSIKLKKHKTIAAEYAKSSSGILYVRSTDYMNNSGIGVGALLRYYKIPQEQVLILHDDLDIAPGVARLKFAGGDGGHNGLKSMISHLQGRDFWRLRLGVGRPPQQQGVSNYVLGLPSIADALKIRRAIAAVVCNIDYLQQGDDQAFMRIVHNLEEL